MSDLGNEHQPATEKHKQQSDLKSVSGSAKSMLATVMKIKDSNPKLFFGGVGGLLVVIILLMATGGGDSSPEAKLAVKELKAGQRYALKSANVYDPSATTVRLVSAPGTIAAYDDTEESDRSGACQHMAQGTPVTALEFADAYGKKNTYVKVRIEEGVCKGKEGWALTIDVN